MALDGAREGSFDVVVRDAFVSGMTLDHLCTVEYVDRAWRALVALGAHPVNCAHGSLASACQDVAALQEMFPFMTSIQDPKVERGRRRGNIVTLASATDAADVGQIDRALRMLVLPARTTRPADLTC